MGIISRGFGGRRREPVEGLPPGQYVTTDFPVLSAGPTPHIAAATWTFDLVSEHGERAHWGWTDLMRAPIDTITTDIHCVTRWSKFGTRWRGVSLDHLLPAVQSSAQYAMVGSHGGYTTNVPVADLSGATWRTALCAAPDAAEPRFLPLPLTLRADPNSIKVVRTPRPSAVQRLARRARRALAAVLRRRTASRAAKAGKV